jgi:hypothetical protein
MAYRWGSTVLKIVPFTYCPPHADNGLSEITILPDGTTNPSTVIQQAGRGRKRVSFDGFTTSYSDYIALYNDYIALTERTYTDENDTITMIIETLSPAKMITDSKYEYSISLMEV